MPGLAAKACQPKEAAEARKTRRDETNALFSPLFLTLSLLTSLLGSRTEKCDLARVGLAAELRGRAGFFSISNTLPASLRFFHSHSTLTEWFYRPQQLYRALELSCATLTPWRAVTFSRRSRQAVAAMPSSSTCTTTALHLPHHSKPTSIEDDFALNLPQLATMHSPSTTSTSVLRQRLRHPRATAHRMHQAHPAVLTPHTGSCLYANTISSALSPLAAGSDSS